MIDDGGIETSEQKPVTKEELLDFVDRKIEKYKQRVPKPENPSPRIIIDDQKQYNLWTNARYQAVSSGNFAPIIDLLSKEEAEIEKQMAGEREKLGLEYHDNGKFENLKEMAIDLYPLKDTNPAILRAYNYLENERRMETTKGGILVEMERLDGNLKEIQRLMSFEPAKTPVPAA